MWCESANTRPRDGIDLKVASQLAQGLAKQIGDRFWNAPYNSGLFFALQPAIQNFLADRDLAKKGLNQLELSVSVWGCDKFLNTPDLVYQQHLVMAEMRASGIMQYAFFGPGLLCVNNMITADDQTPVLTLINSFGLLVTADICRRLMTPVLPDTQGNIAPYGFLVGSALPQYTIAHDDTVQLAGYAAVCNATTEAFDDMTVALLMFIWAEIVKVNSDMSMAKINLSERATPSKDAGNICCEKPFGLLEWMLRRCREYSLLQTNAICMAKTNNTIQYFRNMPSDQLKLIFKTTCNKVDVERTKEKQWAREKLITNLQSDRQDEAIAKGALKVLAGELKLVKPLEEMWQVTGPHSVEEIVIKTYPRGHHGTGLVKMREIYQYLKVMVLCVKGGKEVWSKSGAPSSQPKNYDEGIVSLQHILGHSDLVDCVSQGEALQKLTKKSDDKDGKAAVNQYTLLSDAVESRYCPINFEYVTTLTDKRKLEGDANKAVGRCSKRRREEREVATATEESHAAS